MIVWWYYGIFFDKLETIKSLNTNSSRDPFEKDWNFEEWRIPSKLSELSKDFVIDFVDLDSSWGWGWPKTVVGWGPKVASFVD